MVRTSWLDKIWTELRTCLITEISEVKPGVIVAEYTKKVPKLSPQCQALFNLFTSRPDRCVWNYEIRERYFEGIGHIMNHTGRISDLRAAGYEINEVKKVGGSRLYRMEL
jgi:hypothetical protein